MSGLKQDHFSENNSQWQGKGILELSLSKSALFVGKWTFARWGNISPVDRLSALADVVKVILNSGITLKISQALYKKIELPSGAHHELAEDGYCYLAGSGYQIFEGLKRIGGFDNQAIYKAIVSIVNNESKAEESISDETAFGEFDLSLLDKLDKLGDLPLDALLTILLNEGVEELDSASAGAGAGAGASSDSRDDLTEGLVGSLRGLAVSQKRRRLDSKTVDAPPSASLVFAGAADRVAGAMAKLQIEGDSPRK